MALKKIFASRVTVDANHGKDEIDPVFTVLTVDGAEHRSNSLIVLGPSEFRYDHNGPIGKRVWIETYAKVVLKGSDPDEPILESV